jgi:hypothetical protein
MALLRRPLERRILIMSQIVQETDKTFVDRREGGVCQARPAHERRQFADSYEELSPEAQELARAIDAYKAIHRRRFITYEEMHAVITSLGYRK